MAYAVKCLSTLLLLFMGEFREFSIVASFQIGILWNQGFHSAPFLAPYYSTSMFLIVLVLCPQYADDTVLYRPIYSVHDEVNLQTDLDTIWTWSTINKLPLNAAKCVVMDITRSHRPISISYHMGDTRETISTHKHLGIVLSSNLEWDPHVDEVTSKAKRLLGFILRTVGSNDTVTMKKLFVALVRPIIEYCAPLWAQNKESHKHKLKGFRGVSLDFAFPVLGTQDMQAPDSRYSHHYFPLWLSSYHVCCWCL